MFEINSDPVLSTAGHHAADQEWELSPEVWLSESRDAAVRFVYTPVVIEAVQRVERGLTEEIEPVELPEE